jgi:hypothetical protein
MARRAAGGHGLKRETASRTALGRQKGSRSGTENAINAAGKTKTQLLASSSPVKNGVLGGVQLDIVLSLPLPPTTPRDQRMHLAFLMLDNTIGEFEVMTSIGTVEAVTHPAESSPRGMRPLSDLPAELARALPPRRQ